VRTDLGGTATMTLSRFRPLDQADRQPQSIDAARDPPP
jgi:hypothetical protein